MRHRMLWGCSKRRRTHGCRLVLRAGYWSCRLRSRCCRAHRLVHRTACKRRVQSWWRVNLMVERHKGCSHRGYQWGFELRRDRPWSHLCQWGRDSYSRTSYRDHSQICTEKQQGSSHGHAAFWNDASGIEIFPLVEWPCWPACWTGRSYWLSTKYRSRSGDFRY